ncbi:hypothetical protein BXZ70DRAFT_1004339 [Cristinia sonorae]|uniref:MYND-type domain-containing protein n=1 Tax=Cristinia sonorae TaxID=1940300 RepID=A0A8K0UWF1_9AGAR|nr:hypothetical protein BXZ70DRAFT_1004339 [Cristinia sonorae]
MHRQSKEAPSLKMCPCREAYYCGPEHQKLHWKVHRKTCFNKQHTTPLTALERGVMFLLQTFDATLVELAIKAMLKEDVNIDLEHAVNTQAVEFLIEPRDSMEDLEAAVDAGKIPPVRISREVKIVSIAEECKRRGIDPPYFEHPADRQSRIRRNRLGVVMIFQPGGRAVTKATPNIQLGMWRMMQENEKKTTNPPIFYLSIHTTNSMVGHELQQEADPRGFKEESERLDRDAEEDPEVDGLCW